MLGRQPCLAAIGWNWEPLYGPREIICQAATLEFMHVCEHGVDCNKLLLDVF